jgi:carbamoyltransferase
MRILGVVSETHDTGVALLENGSIVSILEEERHNREKHTQQFPLRSLQALFGANGRGLADVDLITTPWDTRRLRRTFAAALLRRFPGSLNLLRPSAHTTQDSGVAFLNFWLRRDLKRYFPGGPLPPIVNVGHHESHAALFFVSPFDDATVIVMDGYGDDAATSVFTGQGNHLQRHWHGRFFDSLGMVYTLITRHLGFEPFEEGTVMALAALGRDRFVDKMRQVVRLEPNGQFSINMHYFSYDTYGMLRPFRHRFLEAFGPPRRRDEPITDHHRDLAYALQHIAEGVILHVVRAARQQHPSQNLCLVGGVALNCVANARLQRESGYDRIWVPPCASDTGAPLGSALWHYHRTLQQPRRSVMTHAYYGTAYDEHEIEVALQSQGLRYSRLEQSDLISAVARDLADGRVVGWFQGRYEIGPRALGNRSILASPISPNVRDVINRRIKFREPFRPFAPSVLVEQASEYFEIAQADPFMTTAPRVRPGMARRIPAAVHADGTARIQTVDRLSNPLYHALIARFGEMTGVPVLLNTSFNKQEPIVARPEEAISCFLRTDMDVLVMGNHYVTDRPEDAVRRARSSFEVIQANARGGE